MKISSKAHYGLQAVYLLAVANDKAVSAKELEKEIGVSCKYLERIMRTLTGAGVVKALRGTQGGYYLAKPASELTAGDVVRALEDDLEIIGCVKNGTCVKCSSSGVWRKLYDGINQILDSIKISDMVSGDKQIKHEHSNGCCYCSKE